MKTNFNELENKLITMVYDDKDKYTILIDSTNQVCIYNKEESKIIYKLGDINVDLVVKLFKYIEIDVTIDDSIRVIENKYSI